MDALRTCAAAQLGLIARPVVEFGIVAGSHHPPADKCACTGDSGEQGVGWVRMTDQHLSEYVSLREGPPIDNQPCKHDVWIVDVEVGVYRCWPSPTGSLPPKLPAVEKVTAAARGIVDDAAALRRTLLCCDWLQTQDIGWYNARATTLAPPAAASAWSCRLVQPARTRLPGWVPVTDSRVDKPDQRRHARRQAQQHRSGPGVHRDRPRRHTRRRVVAATPEQSRWHVQLLNVDGVVTRATTVSQRRVRFVGLRSSTGYGLRVRGVDGDGRVSRWSTAWEFTTTAASTAGRQTRMSRRWQVLVAVMAAVVLLTEAVLWLQR